MKLEDKKVILKKIKRLPDQIENYTICSFKKDRSIKAYTQNTEKGRIYFLNEEGYDTQTFMFTEKKNFINKEFHKQMKKLIEKEFPRSHKLYVHQQF
ncbi:MULTISPECIES: hypothetical protein [Enterococcus]|uniref:hypothetical protein n=1 Tax=Enterococcus TaxID=1350 RepID=UPI000934F893|nr:MULTISPECIES: hypothetical protein [Enterococcus]EGP4876871.1 hypothetical protein [Enterococcus faecium]EGP5037597.1 hypothetical protein [Enterococcus faecium]EGP5189484.1 hypothetical protein [Enterococcus faecium]EGP5575557.1 hypothetical protein [Enterococcus faecium]EME8225767.1 hypothetical protein [Enterococcus faecium]